MRADLRAVESMSLSGDRPVAEVDCARLPGPIIDDRFTGLRGFAALGVVITHYHYNGFLTDLPVFKYAGQFLIFIFFFLSSFLLCHSLESSLSKGTTVKAVVNYFINRIFRIYPMLLLTVFSTWYFSVVYFDPHAPFHRALRDTLSLGKAPSVLWTIPIELRFYLILPFLFLFFRSLRRFRYAPAAMLAAFVAWCLMIQYFSLSGARDTFLVTLGIHHYVNILVGGIIGYLVLVREDGSPAVPAKARSALVMALPLAFALFVFLFPYFVRSLFWGDYHLSGLPEEADREAYYDYVFPCIPLLIGLIFAGLLYHEKSLLAAVLKTRLFRTLGFVSFSLYLLHVPILYLWREHVGSGTVQLVMCLAVTIAVSWLCSTLVERSFIQFGKRLNLA